VISFPNASTIVPLEKDSAGIPCLEKISLMSENPERSNGNSTPESSQFSKRTVRSSLPNEYRGCDPHHLWNLWRASGKGIPDFY